MASADLPPAERLNSGLIALSIVAGHFRIAVEPAQLSHELGLGQRVAGCDDIIRAAHRLGLKARVLRGPGAKRIAAIPLPAMVSLTDGRFAVLASRHADGRLRIGFPWDKTFRDVTLDEFVDMSDGDVILIGRRLGGAGADPGTFGFRWFFQSVWRYRKPLTHVLVASLFIQAFGLMTPLLFQVVIDKVLIHKAMSTLLVVVIGLGLIGIFEVALQYLRSYALSHTTSRIDVELGTRLFDHLLRLPLAYFETRAAGQTVARVRELETIRAFLTGQGLTSALDVLFTFVFVAVLLAYSVSLTVIVLLSLPIYIVIAMAIRPILRERINERFNTGASSQQFLVESIVGIHTLKAAAVEPILRTQWEEKLAAYVRASFQAVVLSSLGQSLIQYVSKATTVLVLFFGAQAVINGEMTVGGLIAFNMIMNQVTAPILRLSQLWQDFQQAQVSIERLGDILNSPPEGQRLGQVSLPPARGAVSIDGVTFRYTPGGTETLSNIDLRIPAGQIVGIVGPSGSGKSTLTKLIQRLYRPDLGQVLIDGVDISQVDTAWLRRQIGVVLQDNMLFNRTIHDNIALANPGMSRAQAIAVARLAGADEFIAKLPLGYDTMVEERGANLSGGQRQRVAIARALATQPRILIFDEATSALDYESEQIIQSNMSEIVRGRTVIIIAHRLAAVRICNRIVAIKDGRVVEDGTHEELLRRPEGFYARLWRLQSGTAAPDEQSVRSPHRAGAEHRAK
ncbi:type I secretion system permease/ATPase [Rhodopseudomonas sp. HC1]|nr:type I secretion system permease/ATPase [Rhodopseudomonas infernalis]MCG6206406.1 type I secretion system permease/ATPase [Rhodopseudomonas infernalis]